MVMLFIYKGRKAMSVEYVLLENTGLSPVLFDWSVRDGVFQSPPEYII